MTAELVSLAICLSSSFLDGRLYIFRWTEWSPCFLTTDRVSKIYRLYILYTFPMIVLKFYKSNMGQKLFVYVLSPFFKIGIVRN